MLFLLGRDIMKTRRYTNTIKKGDISLSFVIPVYNEANRLPITFQALYGLSLPDGFKLEKIIFVNDGSTDNTYETLIQELNRFKSRFPKTIVSIVSYKENHGKGYAVKAGMKESSSDYTLFFDADISTPLTELTKFTRAMQKQIDVIVGTRKNGHSTVIKHQPFVREFLGRCFTFITRFTLNTWVTDFTCGFKAFSRRAKHDIFKQASINRWGYDAEILFLAKKNKYSLIEVPVLWSNDERTKVKLMHAIPQTLKELAQIRYNHSIRPVSSVVKPSTAKSIARLFF